MSTTLAATDPDVRTFEATVTAVDGRDVRLSETYFYPEGGGQPADRGVLGGVEVTHVREAGDDVVHTLADEPDVTVGETVSATVDDAFRTYCMRAHTASHALYGAGRRLLDDLGYGGFGIDSEKVRVDFATSTTIDDETLVELERLVNRTVWDSRPVSWEELPVEEAHARDDVAFNAKTEEGVMADSDAVRVVTIEDWDVAACGGTHVSNTREIGLVEVLDRSNPGEGLTRVEFSVGPPGIDRRAEIHGAALDAARTLGTPVTEVGEAASALRAERDELSERVRELEAAAIERRLSNLDAVERDGATWRVGTVSGVGPNDVGDPLQSLVGDDCDVAAVAGEDGTTFVVVATDGTVDAGDVVGDVTERFGGGGGGSPTFAQGGGIDAAPEDVVTSLRG
jgi:alanyl-tRNA synthetase